MFADGEDNNKKSLSPFLSIVTSKPTLIVMSWNRLNYFATGSREGALLFPIFMKKVSKDKFRYTEMGSSP